MLSPEHRQLLAIFCNGGVSADKSHAQAAVRTYLHTGDPRVSEQAISQVHAQVDHYMSVEHKTNHDEIAEALLALVDELHAA